MAKKKKKTKKTKKQTKKKQNKVKKGKMQVCPLIILRDPVPTLLKAYFKIRIRLNVMQIWLEIHCQSTL